jgi:site-specific DNA recombinase
VNSEVHVGVSGIVDSMFRKNLGDKVRRGWDGRVQQGLTPGSPAYGYRTVLGKPCEREIDPETSGVVRRIFREYVEQRPLRQIAADLSRDGILTPMGGKAWNHQTFVAGSGNGKGIIGNRIYIGELIWYSHRTTIHPDTKKRVKR